MRDADDDVGGGCLAAIAWGLAVGVLTLGSMVLEGGCW
jgi:hypothetical protein